MAAGIVNISIDQGATYRSTILWKTGTPAVAVNIAGYTARMMMKPTSVFDASQITAITKANPGVVTTKKNHLLKNEQTVVLLGVGGMTQLTSRYQVTILSPTTFSIGVDTSAYGTYTSGGVVAFVSITDVLNNDGQLVLGTTGGDIGVYIKDSVTNTMIGGGAYDLEMVAATGDVTRLVQGSFAVVPNVTK